MRPDVRRWFGRRTSRAEDWPLAALLAGKGAHRVSVVLPARDEQATVAGVLAAVAPLRRAGLVDELVVMDSGSRDATAAVAQSAGAEVYAVADVLQAYGDVPGKGEALWKSLHVTTGDLVVFLDADLVGVTPQWVTGLLGPLLTDPAVVLVKAAYERPLGHAPGGGGRVTELVARPLLAAHWPALAGLVQPLAGEYAARRDVLEAVPFAAGYGVELGLLVDVLALVGLDGFAQVDLGRRVHRNQDNAALGRMAAVLQATALSRLPNGTAPATLTQFQRVDGLLTPLTTGLPLGERPPMASIPEHRARAAS